MNETKVTKVMNNTRINESPKTVKLLSVRGMTVMSLLAVIATLLMLLDVPLWFLPSFYQVDFSEVPVLIGAFALGPMAGVLIELVKIMLNFILNGTDTAGIGEIANLILGCSFVVPSAIIYLQRKSKKSAIIGMGVGTIVFIITGCLLNAYLLLPAYSKVYGIPIDSLVAAGTAVNPNINSLGTFIILAVAPFNLIKGVAVSIVTALLYKYISPVIKGYHNKNK